MMKIRENIDMAICVHITLFMNGSITTEQMVSVLNSALSRGYPRQSFILYARLEDSTQTKDILGLKSLTQLFDQGTHLSCRLKLAHKYSGKSIVKALKNSYYGFEFINNKYIRRNLSLSVDKIIDIKVSETGMKPMFPL